MAEWSRTTIAAILQRAANLRDRVTDTAYPQHPATLEPPFIAGRNSPAHGDLPQPSSRWTASYEDIRRAAAVMEHTIKDGIADTPVAAWTRARVAALREWANRQAEAATARQASTVGTPVRGDHQSALDDQLLRRTASTDGPHPRDRGAAPSPMDEPEPTSTTVDRATGV